jgi:hypothetical protein
MIDRNPLLKNVCTACGAPITAIEARLYGGSCTARRCRTSYWEGVARRLQQEKRQLASEKAKQRQARALAHRDHLAAELLITNPQALLSFAVPSHQRSLVLLSATRKALFREYIERIIHEAFQETVPPEASAFSEAEQGTSSRDETQPILLAGCAVCQGRCCLRGRDHSYLTADVIRRYRARHPATSAGEVFFAYDSRLAERAYEDSCVYHQEEGCGLPRDLRSDTCNWFECEELAELRRGAGLSGDGMLLVAFDGDRAVRWAVHDWTEFAAESQVPSRLDCGIELALTDTPQLTG